MPYPKLTDFQKENADPEVDQPLNGGPKKLPKIRLRSCIDRSIQCFTLAICVTLLIFMVFMEMKEEAIEDKVAVMAKSQLKNAHKTGRMLNQILSLSDYGSVGVADSDIQALCSSAKCGLQCAHGKSEGYVSFLDGLVKKIPSALELIPGFGQQLAQVTNMALGLQESIRSSQGFKLNGVECARSMLQIFKDKKAKDRASALGRKAKSKKQPSATIQDVTHLSPAQQKHWLEDVSPDDVKRKILESHERAIRRKGNGRKKRSTDDWMLRFKREAETYGDEINIDGEDETEEEVLGSLLEEETGVTQNESSDSQMALSLLLSEIFRLSFE